MKNVSIAQQDKTTFLKNSVIFIEEFEADFVDYFACLCVNYDCTVVKEEARTIASMIYSRLFQCEKELEALQEDFFTHLREDGVMIGFLVSRSMLYLMEKYIEFCKAHAIVPQLELLLGCVGRFMNFLENDITPKVDHVTGMFDVQLGDDITLTPSNNIIDAFTRMKALDEKIIFLNLYKGVPISSEATIIEIEGENVTFEIDRLQEIAMKLDGQAFIVKNNYLSKHLKADIVYSNFKRNTITLTNFIYLLNMPALQREFVRVHPDIIADVYLHQFDNLQTRGRLYDLSMSGLGVVSDENNGVFIGAKVFISFELNNSMGVTEEEKKIELQGEVINIIEYKNSFRYCMRIFPDHVMSERILHYITQREKEILEDLDKELNEYVV